MNKVFIICLFLFSAPSMALTILHQESVDGDLDNIYFPDFGELAPDQYIIEGSIRWTGCLPDAFPCIYDLDAFSLSVPDNYTLDYSITASINLDLPADTIANINHLELIWEVYGFGNSYDLDVLSWGMNAVGNPVTQGSDNFAGNGTGYFFQTSTGSLLYEGPEFYDPDGITMDYVISLDVHPVPLPGALVLFASGLLGFLGIQGKKKPR